MPNDLVVVLVVSQSPTSAKVLRSTRIVTIQVTWSGAVSRVAGDRVTERVHDVVAVFTGNAEHPAVVLRLRGRATLGATSFAVLTDYAERLAAVGGCLYLSGVDPALT